MEYQWPHLRIWANDLTLTSLFQPTWSCKSRWLFLHTVAIGCM